MAEFTNVAAQTVAANGNVVFSNTAVKGSNCIQHREGSGIITLRGLTNQCKARFFVDFSGNIAIPTGGTVGAISPLHLLLPRKRHLLLNLLPKQ